jgi:F-type H+-transporting ATPase subunit epsilon
MADSIQFELVSPEKLLISKPVAMVTVPGGEGEYGVLAGHSPLITTVKAGVIGIYADDMDVLSERIFVAGGFAETTQTRCTVLADEAIPVKQLNRFALETEAKTLADKIAATPEAERDALLVLQEVVTAKLAAAA